MHFVSSPIRLISSISLNNNNNQRSFLFHYLFVAFLFMSFMQSASADVPSGLTWLKTQQQSNGAYGNETDISTENQATAEVITTYQVLGEAIPANTRQTFKSYTLTNTETLARKLISGLLAPQESALVVTELLSRQNRDGGFGEFEGYDSTPLDAAFVLQALANTVGFSQDKLGAALSYINNSQADDGSWSIPSVNSGQHYVTSEVLMALSYWREQYSLAAQMIPAVNWMKSQLNPENTFTNNFENAMALLVLPSQISDKTILDTLEQSLLDQQDATGSWESDVYITALAIRALKLYKNPPTSVNDASVFGTLLNKDTQEPISGAVVTIAGKSIESDVQGKFEISGIAAGPSTLGIQAISYQAYSSQLSLNAGDIVRLGNIELTPAALTASLVGHIYNSSGNPLAGVIVSVGTVSTTTDATGQYTLTGINKGSGTISAIKPGYRTLEANQVFDAGYTYQFSPTLYGVNVTPPPSTLIGKVIDKDTSQVLANVSIKVGSLTETTGTDGLFNIANITAGSSTIIVSLAGYESLNLNAQLVSGANNIGTIALTKALTKSHVVGRIVDNTSGQAIANVTVSLLGTNTQVLSDSNGEFSINDVATLSFDLNLSVGGYLEQTIKVALNSHGERNIGEIKLAKSDVNSEFATLKGRVLDSAGNPVAGVEVKVGDKTVTTDGSGVYTLNEIPQGTAVITISKTDYRTIDRSQNFKKGFVYQLSPTLYKTNEPPAPTKLVGKVLSKNTGNALANVTIKAGSVTSQSLVSGEFVLEGLEAGEVLITLSLDGYVSQTLKATLVEGVNNLGVVSLSEPLVSNSDFEVTSMVASKTSYSPGDTAQVDVGIINKGTEAQSLVIEMEVFDSQGVFVDSIPGNRGLTGANGRPSNLPVTFSSNEERGFDFGWFLQNYPAGDYEVSVKGRLGNQLVVQKQLSLSVKSEPVLQGSVIANPPLVQLDAQTPISLTGDFRNVGNQSTPQGQIHLKITLDKVDTNQAQVPRTELVTVDKESAVPDTVYDLAIDSNDNHYVINNDRSKVLKILPDGTGTTDFFVLPKLNNHQMGAWQIEIDKNDNIYVAGWNNYDKGLIYKLDTNATIVETIPLETSFTTMAVNEAGDIFVTGKNAGNDVLVKLSNGAEEILWRNGLSNPQEMLLDNDFLFVTNYSDGSIVKVGINSGVINRFVSGLKSPKGITKGSDGNYYVVTAADGKIIKIAPDGTMTDYATGLKNPSDLAFNAAGELFVSSLTDRAIYKIGAAGDVTLFAKSAISAPSALTIDANDNVYVVTNGNSISKKTEGQSDYVELVTGLNSPRDIEAAFDNSLFIAEYGSGKIAHWVNNAKEDFSTGLKRPYGIALNPNGDVAVSVSGNKIHILDQSGQITKTYETKLTSPSNVVFGENNEVYVQNNQFISVIESGEITKISVTGSVTNIYKISFDPIKKKLIVFDSSGKLYWLDKNGDKELVNTQGTLSLRTNVSIDNQGRIYYVNNSVNADRVKVKRIEADGSSTEIVTFSHQIRQLQSDKNGKMYALLDSNQIFKFDSTGQTSDIQFDNGNEHVYDFYVMQDAENLIAWTNYNRIYKINVATGARTQITVPQAVANVKILFDSQNRSFKANSSAHSVTQYDNNNAPTKAFYGFGTVYDIDWDSTNQRYVFVDSYRRIMSIDNNDDLALHASGVNGTYLYTNQGKLYSNYSSIFSEIDGTGHYKTLATIPNSNLSNTGFARKSSGEWVIADSLHSGRIVELNSDYSIKSIQGGLNSPHHIVFDANDQLIVGDHSAGILAVDQSGLITWLNTTKPSSLFTDDNGIVFASDNTKLYQFDTNWARTEITPANQNGHSGLRGFVRYQNKNYAFNRKSQLIADENDAWQVFASGLSNPKGLVVFKNDLYIANANNGTITRFKNQELSVVNSAISGIQGFAANDEFIYAGKSSSILQFNPVTNTTTKIRLGFNRAMSALTTDSEGIVANYNRYYDYGSRSYHKDFLHAKLTQAVTPPAEGSVVYETSQAFSELAANNQNQSIDFGTWVAPYGGDFKVEVSYPGVNHPATNFIHVGGHIESELVAMQSSLPVGDSSLPMCLNLSGADFASVSKVEINQVRGVVDSPRPLGLSANKEGSVFFTENTSLFKTTDSGRELVAGNFGATAYGLGVDNSERFYTASKYNGSSTYHLLRITQSGDVTDVLDLGVTTVGGVQVNIKDEVVVGTAGKLLIINQQGEMRTVVVNQLNPKQIAIDGRGNVYAQNNNNSVIMISPSGGTSIVFDRSTNPEDPGFEGDGYPTITADCADNLYVTAFSWSKVPQQTGEEKILVQMNPSRNSLNVLFDITKINSRAGDIDYLAYDRFGQRILMWDEHAYPKRIWQVPVTCGAIDAKVHLFTKPNQSLSAATIEANSSLVHTDRKTEHVWDLRNVTAKGESVCFNVDVKGLTLGETRKAIDSGFISFDSTFANNEIKVPLLVPNIQGDNIVDLLVATDKPSYLANADAAITGNFTNKLSTEVTGQLVFIIVDAQGQEIARIEKGDVSIPANDSLASNVVWNTSNTLVGDYKVLAKLYQGDLLVAESKTDFKIQYTDSAQQEASLRVTTDKPVYNTSDQVTLGSLSHNLTANVLLNAVSVQIKVVAPDNSLMAEITQTVGDLASGNMRQLNSILALASAAEGQYSVTGKLLDADQNELASAETQFDVKEALAQTIIGDVVVEQQSIYAGAPQSCENTISNMGTLPLNDAIFRQVLVNIDTSAETIFNDQSITISSKGGISKFTSAVDSKSLTQGQYGCILQRKDGNKWQTLAFKFFKVDMLAMNAALDASQYLGNTPVNITMQVDNPSGIDFAGNVKLTVLDANSNSVAELTPVVAQVPGSSSVDLSALWNTGSNPVGDYSIVASLVNDADQSLELHTLPFSIGAKVVLQITLRTTTDKPQYKQGSPVNVNNLIVNKTPSVTLENAKLAIRVTSPSGRVVYEGETAVAKLSARSISKRKLQAKLNQGLVVSFNLQNNAPLGDYAVSGKVISDSQDVLASSATTFKVIALNPPGGPNNPNNPNAPGGGGGDPVEPIPTLSEWSMLLLVLSLGISGLWLRRKETIKLVKQSKK